MWRQAPLDGHVRPAWGVVVVLVQRQVQEVYLYVQASPTGKDCMLYTCTKAHMLGLRML